MKIRDAAPADAAAACQVLRRSIVELCVADHHNDPAILDRWLANKTPEIVASWIAQPSSSMLLAIEDGAILAVGSVTDAGEITLNYVSPDARFRGVSRALLRALEGRAVERGNTRCTLLSTETARRFYHSLGYAEDGPPEGKFGTSSSYPMSKQLAAILLKQITEQLPAGFETLRAEARAEGYKVIERLALDWASGATRFDRAGEALFAAYSGGELAAVGGLTIDPAIPGALRLRRFYVRKRFRRGGVGRRLAAALLDRVAEERPVMVNAGRGSEAFWQSLGFTADERDGHTHMLQRADRSVCG
jgi:GNAT superfamily N-acetyltransferase